MRVEKIMTREVITAAPDTTLKDVAGLLVANRISGVPVCSPNGDVLGVVSEADILRREEGVSPELARPIVWFARRLDGELDKIGACTAGEAMTAPARTVRPTQDVSEAVCIMVDSRINRVPVVSGGRLVGIVSRADLMRAFIQSDEEIEREIRQDVLLEMMLLAPGDIEVSVKDGSVVLSGQVNMKRDAEALERFVRRIPGVLDVQLDLRWRPVDPRRAPVAGWS